MKFELKIGETIEDCKIILECRKNNDGNCFGCYWFYEDEHLCLDVHNCCGQCSLFQRTDETDVIFVKVGEVED